MKRLFCAILWITFYGGICWVISKHILGFDILSSEDWGILLDKSLVVWPSRIVAKKIVGRSLLVMIIVGILGLGITLKKKRPPRTKPVFVQPGSAVASASFVPSKMPSQGRISAFSAPAPSPEPAVLSPNLPPPSAERPINPLMKAIQQITALTEKFDATAFPHVKLENTFTPLIISDDSTALPLKILSQDGLWQVQQTPEIEDSIWTIADLPPQKLMKDVIESTRTLVKLEPEAEAITTIVLTLGSFENLQETLNYFSSKNIRVATLLPNDERIEGIPTLEELFTEFYSPKQEEENVPETEVS